MAVVVTVAKGYDLGYVWKNQRQPGVEKTAGGYYFNAAQAAAALLIPAGQRDSRPRDPSRLGAAIANSV